MNDKCCYPGCRRDSDLVYLTKPLCDTHWNMIDIAPERLRQKIGLPPAEVVTPAMRVPQKARQAVSAQPQEPPKRSVMLAKSQFKPRLVVRKPIPAAPKPSVGAFNTAQEAERPARWGAQG